MPGPFVFAGAHVDMTQNGQGVQGTVGVDVAVPGGSVSVDVTGASADPMQSAGGLPGDMSVDAWGLVRPR